MEIVWCVQLTLIAVWGEICFTETNTGILYVDIAAIVLVVLFAVLVFVVRYIRLTERPASDHNQQDHRA
jgi:heme/copper-type cytochrome/quinol oxidase subunit 2